MPRVASEWRAYVEEALSRVTPVLTRAGIPPSGNLRVVLGSPLFVQYDAASEQIRLGFSEDEDGRLSRALWAEVLVPQDGDELERILELLFLRLGVAALARHLRVFHRAATEDEWLEIQVANAVAHAATTAEIEPHRDFLRAYLTRIVEDLQQRRILGLPGPEGMGDPACTQAGEHLLAELTWFLGDLAREDRPDLEETLAGLVAPKDRSSRRVAESELVLLQTLSEGPPQLRRAAAEIFSEEASAEAISKLLASPRVLPSDVKLMLAESLIRRGAPGDAAPALSSLALNPRTPAPVAAAAALLLEDPHGSGTDPAAMLGELEDAGLTDALKLVKQLWTTQGVAAVWPLLSHPHAPARKEAYRLMAQVLPEGDAWAGVDDPEPSIRAASVSMLSGRPGLPRAVAKLLLDEDATVRTAALARARSNETLTNDIGTLLAAQETDDARKALAAVVAERHPSLAEDMLGRVIARRMRPFTTAWAAAGVAEPRDRHLDLVLQLALDALDREQAALIAYAAQARGRADWLEIFQAMEGGGGGTEGEEAARLLDEVLPEGWYQALHVPPNDFEPVPALRALAVDHPEPFVRAAILLWLGRGGHLDPELAARVAEADPTNTVAEVARVLRRPAEESMALTTIEKALFLRTVPLLRSVPTPNLLALAGAMRASDHEAGETILKQGEIGDRLYVLLDGAAQARKEAPGAAPQTLASYGPGAVFGEMSLFDSEPRSATVVATEPCRTLMLDGQTFHRLGLQYPEILWEVCRVLTNRLRALGQSVGPRPAARPTKAA